jgi:hypothetical protein
MPTLNVAERKPKEELLPLTLAARPGPPGRPQTVLKWPHWGASAASWAGSHPPAATASPCKPAG